MVDSEFWICECRDCEYAKCYKTEEQMRDAAVSHENRTGHIVVHSGKYTPSGVAA